MPAPSPPFFGRDAAAFARVAANTARANDASVMCRYSPNRLHVIGADGLLELPGELRRLDVRLELAPACETVLPGNLDLRPAQRIGPPGLEKVLGLVFEVAEVGIRGELARVLRSGRT